MKRGIPSLVFALVIAGAASVVEAAIQITSCNVVVPANERGVLQNDIACEDSCSGDRSILCNPNFVTNCGPGLGTCSPEGLVLEHGAKLDLNGYTLTSAYHARAVRCGATDDEVGTCTVRDGTIVGRKGTAISSTKMNVVVKNVTIGSANYAIRTDGSLVAKGLVTLSDRENWIRVGGVMTLRDSHLKSGASSEGDAKFVNLKLGPNGGFVSSTAAVRGRDVVIEEEGGIVARDVSVKRATVIPDPSGYVDVAIEATRDLRLVDSDVTLIASGTEPVLKRSTCDISKVYGTSDSWGVCTED